jgi:hypothetical protein
VMSSGRQRVALASASNCTTSTYLPTNSGGAFTHGTQNLPGTATRSADPTRMSGQRSSKLPMTPSWPFAIPHHDRTDPRPRAQGVRNGRMIADALAPRCAERSTLDAYGTTARASDHQSRAVPEHAAMSAEQCPQGAVPPIGRSQRDVRLRRGYGALGSRPDRLEASGAGRAGVAGVSDCGAEKCRTARTRWCRSYA